MKKYLLLLVSFVIVAGCNTSPKTSSENEAQSSSESSVVVASSAKSEHSAVPIVEAMEVHALGDSVTYTPDVTMPNAAIAADFTQAEINNMAEMEKAYGFHFSPAEKKFLEANKFLVKSLADTSIRPSTSGDNVREFSQLYSAVTGDYDYKKRTQANALFFSSDVFFHTYNNLFTELLKELENKEFYPAIKKLSTTFYNQAAQKLTKAISDSEKKKWMQVRNYFAIADAIFTSAAQPLTEYDYTVNGELQDPEMVMKTYKEKDATIDTFDTAAAYIKTLALDAPSEKVVLATLKQIYAADAPGVPALFADEYSAYSDLTNIDFAVDFTQFTPRSTYTSSSLRRAYFRGMKWYIMTPMFLKSPALTDYAFGITELMAENPDQLKNYNKIESTIHFLVGTSDDLMPVDYMQALKNAKGAPDQTAAIMEYLVKARNPRIKALAAGYTSAGAETTDDVLLKTKGMYFFSGKFILDSYWTGQLTQGDEQVKPGYPAKLPPMASSLEVMALLGSDYARSQIATLDFYKEAPGAVDKAMADLDAENKTLDTAYWQSNAYTTWLWTIQSLFSWQKEHKDSLPAFMQSPMWEIKTLQTASAFWTELRHATLLNAKQSFAELGGGAPERCDNRKVPPAPMGYIEPQVETYNRLLYLAKRTDQGLQDQGFENLNNFAPLKQFISLMELVQTYVKKELMNTALTETVSSSSSTVDGNPCTEYFIEGTSDWEVLRRGIVDGLLQSLPVPLEGPILPAKDRRAAIVADVHTGGDSLHSPRILYQGTGVPRVIFTEVKDINGPRMTIGFTYSHYEFTEPLAGPRKTDEDWQKNFYKETDDPFAAYDYTDMATWPAENPWYLPLLQMQ